MTNAPSLIGRRCLVSDRGDVNDEVGTIAAIHQSIGKKGDNMVTVQFDGKKGTSTFWGDSVIVITDEEAARIIMRANDLKKVKEELDNWRFVVIRTSKTVNETVSWSRDNETKKRRHSRHLGVTIFFDDVFYTATVGEEIFESRSLEAVWDWIGEKKS